MKLSSQINLGVFALMLLAFTVLSSIELSEIKSRTSVSIEQEAEEARLRYETTVLQTSAMSSQSKQSVIDAMLRQMVLQPFLSAAKVIDVEGNVFAKYERSPNTIVPNWYLQLDSAPAVNKKIPFSNNDGYLLVTSDTSYIYTEITAILIKNAVIFCGLFFALALYIVTVTKFARRPIANTIKKLNEINSHDFTPSQVNAFTTDYRQLTSTVNTLTTSLASKFNDIAQQSERFKTEANKDTLTKLSNRSAFERHTRALLSDTSNFQEKELILIRLAQLTTINTKLGMLAGDNYVKSIADFLVHEAKHNCKSGFVFRLSGGDFALISEIMGRDERDLMLENMSKQFANATPLRDGSKATWMGVTRFSSQMSLQQVMESADSALMAAMKTQKGWQFSSEVSQVHSNTKWRERLNYIVSQQYADILIQPVMNVERNTPAYYETFARFKDKDTNDVIPMAQLIPASERLDLIPQVDKLVAGIVFKKLTVTSHQVAINISNASIANGEFRQWLIEELRTRETLCPRLIFEVEDAALIHHREVAENFCRQLIQLGCRITIEHFGDNFASLAGLRAIQPQFVKLSGRLTQGIHTNKDNQLFVSSLINIAKGLNIHVIAEMVENEAESVALSKLDVEHQQGYYFSKPSLWTMY